jgi:hypothetical protein
MSKGSGKVERCMMEMLSDPWRDRFSQEELIRQAFGVSYGEPLTETQRVWGSRALRNLLASNNAWRRAKPQHFVRDRPAQPSNDKVAIWAYRYAHGVEWEIATIVRRTRTRCTIEFRDERIITNPYLRPISEPSKLADIRVTGWAFVRIRDAVTESMVNADYRTWSSAIIPTTAAMTKR